MLLALKTQYQHIPHVALLSDDARDKFYNNLMEEVQVHAKQNALKEVTSVLSCEPGYESLRTQA
jgi:hypothetical protein